MQSLTKSFTPGTGQTLIGLNASAGDYAAVLAGLTFNGFAGSIIRIYSSTGAMDFYYGPWVAPIQFLRMKKAPDNADVLIDIVGGSGGDVVVEHYLKRSNASGDKWDTQFNGQLGNEGALTTLDGQTLVTNLGEEIIPN